MRTSSPALTPLPRAYTSQNRGGNWRLFLVVCVVHIAAGLVYQHLVWTDDVYRELFLSQSGSGGFEEASSTMRTMSLVGFVTLPLLLWVRLAVVALLLQFGFLLMWKELPFSRLFRIVTVASLTGAAMVCAKTWMVTLSPADELSVSSLTVAPLSLAGMVGRDSYSPAARLVLQNANVFELAWLFLVWLGIRRADGISRADVAFVVLLVWCAILLVQVGVVLVFSGGML